MLPCEYSAEKARYYCLPSDSAIRSARLHIVLKLWRNTATVLLNEGRQGLRQGFSRQQAAPWRSSENVHLVIAQSRFYLLIKVLIGDLQSVPHSTLTIRYPVHSYNP